MTHQYFNCLGDESSADHRGEVSEPGRPLPAPGLLLPALRGPGQKQERQARYTTNKNYVQSLIFLYACKCSSPISPSEVRPILFFF